MTFTESLLHLTLTEEQKREDRLKREEQKAIRIQEQQSRTNGKLASFSWTRLFRGEDLSELNPYQTEKAIMKRIVHGDAIYP